MNPPGKTIARTIDNNVRRLRAAGGIVQRVVLPSHEWELFVRYEQTLNPAIRGDYGILIHVPVGRHYRSDQTVEVLPEGVGA